MTVGHASNWHATLAGEEIASAAVPFGRARFHENLPASEEDAQEVRAHMIVIMPGHLGVRGLFRERVMEINAVDLTEPAPAAPEVILDWKP